ncbi:MAG: hypothetical protein IIC73_01370 [Armatimonadetes bacterium]|nr:hypothetical protein [Armatimonadota bacterium]
MRRTIHASTAIAVCALGAAALGQGQQGRAGALQDGYNGRVRAIDSAVASYFNTPEIKNILTPGGFSEWSLTLKKGQVVIAAARSEAFDPALEIVFIDDEVENVLAKNDDRYPGDQRPFLIWRCEEDGDYKLRARCFEDKAGGQFFLRTKTYDSFDLVAGEPTDMEVEGRKMFLLRLPMKAGEIKQVYFQTPSGSRDVSVSISQTISPLGLPDINLIQPIESVAGNTVMAAVDGVYYVVARTSGRGMGKVRASFRDIPVVELEREDGRYSAEAAVNSLSLWSLSVKKGDFLQVSTPELAIYSKFVLTEQPDISEYDLKNPETNPFFPHADDEEEDLGPAFVELPARAGDPRIGVYVVKRDAVLWLVSNGIGGKDETYTMSVRPAAKNFSSDQEIEGRLRIADTDYWEFEAEAGDVMTFASGTTWFAEKLIVRDPDLREVWSSSLSLDQTAMGWNMIVRKPGRYLVAVSALGDGASGTYTLNRQVFSAREFDKDSPAKGDFSTGQTEIWKFTASPDEPLLIRWESSNWSYSVSILDENGARASLQRTYIDERNRFGILKVSKETTYVIVLISGIKKSDYKITLSDIPWYVKESGVSEDRNLAGGSSMQD